MATQHEHMTADFTRALAEGGVEVVLDGETVQVFASAEEITPGEFERALLVRRRITHLRSAIAEKAPGQIIMLDGVRWEVVGHTLLLISGIILLQRNMG